MDLNRNWVRFVGEVCAELAGRRRSFMLRGFGFVKRKFVSRTGSFAEFHRAFSLPRLVLHIKSVIFQIHADVINLSLVLLLFSNFKKINQPTHPSFLKGVSYTLLFLLSLPSQYTPSNLHFIPSFILMMTRKF